MFYASSQRHQPKSTAGTLFSSLWWGPKIKLRKLKRMIVKAFLKYRLIVQWLLWLLFLPRSRMVVCQEWQGRAHALKQKVSVDPWGGILPSYQRGSGSSFPHSARQLCGCRGEIGRWYWGRMDIAAFVGGAFWAPGINIPHKELGCCLEVGTIVRNSSWKHHWGEKMRSLLDLWPL